MFLYFFVRVRSGCLKLLERCLFYQIIQEFSAFSGSLKDEKRHINGVFVFR
ncbi:MAG: hypothetical protein IJ187_05270 [Neisseriaceae bacterium]|nr:hypothetical protein [Neisseriaceae bacterium]MBR1818653.1 hypothetical protein [Neisseriaceae bacterium]